MDYDKKVYLKYLWDEHLKPRNWIRNSVFYEYLLMLSLISVVFFSDLNLQRKAFLTIGFLIAITAVKFWALYKSGQHRNWNRRKYGIPTKSWIKKMKQKKIQEKKEKQINEQVEVFKDEGEQVK